MPSMEANGSSPARIFSLGSSVSSTLLEVCVPCGRVLPTSSKWSSGEGASREGVVSMYSGGYNII